MSALQHGAIGVAGGAVAVAAPAVALSNGRPGDDWLGMAGPVVGTSVLGAAGVLGLVHGRVGSIAALGAGALAGGVAGLALAKPLARAFADPPAANRDGDHVLLAQAYALARRSPTGREVIDRLEADGVEVRLVDDIDGGTRHGAIAGQHNYVSDRILVSREACETPEQLAETLIHEGQHHIDDVSAFEGAALLARGGLEERMVANEAAAFRTGGRAMLELLEQRAPDYLAAVRAGKQPPPPGPGVERLLETLRNNYAVDPDTLELQDDASLRAELDRMGYAKLL